MSGLEAIRERYWQARGRTPMVLTLTTTQDCNLGCYYCYKSRTKDTLGEADVSGIVAWTRQQEAVAVVDKLLDVVRVDLRFNADRGNNDDLEGFVGFCRERGWFDRPFLCVFQLARISEFSERAGFLSRTKLTEAEFEKVREHARVVVPDEATLDEVTTRSIYPLPRTSVCAALADDSIVVGADGHHYRCGLQVGEKARPVALREKGGGMTPGPDANWWTTFDPTRQPNCSRCSFLPVCWGGCPKEHLEKDAPSLHETSLYWRKALPQKIAWQFGVALDESAFSFSEADQFRSA